MNGNYKRGLERLIKEYGIDKVNIAIASLSDRSKKVLNMYFGFDQEPMKISEIAESLCNNSIKQIIFRSIARIESILNGEAKLGVYRTKFADIVEIYGEKKVLSVIDNLSEEKYSIITKYFGLNGEIMSSYQDIGEELGLDAEVCYKHISYFMSSLEKKINNQNSGVLRRRFNGLVEEYGVDKVKQTMQKLSPYDVKMARLYFGIENGICVNYDELEKKYSLNNPAYYIHKFVKELEIKLKENKRVR